MVERAEVRGIAWMIAALHHLDIRFRANKLRARGGEALACTKGASTLLAIPNLPRRCAARGCQRRGELF